MSSFSPTLLSVPPSTPFVEYASCHWGAHARWETSEGVKTLAYRYYKHVFSKVLLLHEARLWEQPFDPEDTPRGFTGLHGAAYIGCVEIMDALLKTEKWGVRSVPNRPVRPALGTAGLA